MATPCQDAELFVDGELPEEQAEAFRFHLPDCARCQREVADLMQLKLLGRRYIESDASESDANEDDSSQAPATTPRLRPPARWLRPTLYASGSLAAAVLLVVLMRPLLQPSGPQHDVWLAQRPQRLLEARLSHPGADRYRPPAAQLMGGEDTPEELPLEALATLERSDPHGLAAAYLVRDDKGLAEQALRKLEGLGHSPGLDSDRAVARLLQGQPAEALRLVDGALAQAPQHSQALWNRGLALRELDLPLVAAQAFSQAASQGEPGWAEEAQQKAQALERSVAERRERWQAISRAGRALVDAAPGNLPEGFAQAPVARLYFYDAVRAAPSRERVLALLPLAQALDAQAGGSILDRYVRRVAAADFSRRAPLARDYAALLKGSLPAADHERFLQALLASKEDDILLGALVQADAVARHLKVYEAKAAASADPWFQVLAAQERARADMAAGRWRHATEALLKARKLCTERKLEYRCIMLERELSRLYVHLHQLDNAQAHAERGLQQARASNEWGLEQELLWYLAEIAQFANDTPLARARLTEFLERIRGRPGNERRMHEQLANLELRELRVEQARKEIDAALATGLPLTLSGTIILADISRVQPKPEDDRHLAQALESAMPRLSLGERALATHVLGRFFIERDAKQGQALLWRSIEEAEAPGLQEDVNARRARAYSYTSLILEAGRRGAYGEALGLFAKERGLLELPRQCLLAATVDSERLLLIARGTGGEELGHHEAPLRKPLPARLDGLVPESLLAPLRACPKVEVLARPPLHGRAGLLPPEFAWSYLTRTSGTEAPRTLRPGPAVHLVVSDVELPPDTTLPRLNAWTAAFGAEEQRVTLSGAEATPSRVLGAMKEATEIDLVTHGIINDSSNASYLLLAPGQDGPELSVAQVRTASLQGSPFVVLAACHAAHTAFVLHEPFSLPAAFIEAGARGVLAATVAIPDLEASAFFNAVRERVRSGTPPATALRDERVRWLQQKKGTKWLESVLLFE